MIAGDMLHGHILLADWFFLIAAILIVFYVVLTHVPRRAATEGEVRREWNVSALPWIGVALIALGWWVL